MAKDRTLEDIEQDERIKDLQEQVSSLQATVDKLNSAVGALESAHRTTRDELDALTPLRGLIGFVEHIRRQLGAE